MNTLSWLLLLADTVPSALFALCVAVAVAAGVLGAAWTIAGAIKRSTWWDERSQNRREGVPEPPAYWPIRPISIIVLCIVLSNLVPSKQTIYLIAASEPGEKVAKTQEAAELYDAVRRKVREVLGPQAEPKR